MWGRASCAAPHTQSAVLSSSLESRQRAGRAANSSGRVRTWSCRRRLCWPAARHDNPLGSRRRRRCCSNLMSQLARARRVKVKNVGRRRLGRRVGRRRLCRRRLTKSRCAECREGSSQHSGATHKDKRALPAPARRPWTRSGALAPNNKDDHRQVDLTGARRSRRCRKCESGREFATACPWRWPRWNMSPEQAAAKRRRQRDARPAPSSALIKTATIGHDDGTHKLDSYMT